MVIEKRAAEIILRVVTHIPFGVRDAWLPAPVPHVSLSLYQPTRYGINKCNHLGKMVRGTVFVPVWDVLGPAEK